MQNTAELHLIHIISDQEILYAAEKKNIDLIVIATHGKSAFIHQIMGSVAERVLRGAKCPVLVTRF